MQPLQQMEASHNNQPTAEDVGGAGLFIDASGAAKRVAEEEESKCVCDELCCRCSSSSPTDDAPATDRDA